MTTRIGLNLLWLVPGEVGGSETWAVGLLDAVAASSPAGVQPVLYCSPAFAEAYPWLATAFETCAAPHLGSSRVGRIAAESTWLAAATRRSRVSAVHHLGGTVPLVRSTPSILTIHDLQPLHFPEHFAGAKLTYLKRRLPPSVRASRIVTTVSEFSRADVIERLGADPARTVVTPPAVDPDPAPGPVDVAQIARIHRLDGPWFLYPAVTWRHKDHAVLLHALAEVHRTNPEVLLVLTGAAGPEEATLTALAERLGVAPRVRRPGRVPAAHLDALYRGAVALAFPSRFEGVGLPVLEAMARRCPVVAADATALPEVVGDAGVLAPPGDAAQWAAELVALLEKPARRRALADAGELRIRRWAPHASAAALVDAWRRGTAGP